MPNPSIKNVHFEASYIKLLTIISLCCLGFIVYSDTSLNAFHFDDYPSIVTNSSIKNLANLKAIWNFWPTRFITYLSIAFNYHFHQLDVRSYHLFNLVVHLGSAILAWWFVILTFSTPGMKDKKITQQVYFISFFVGLVFVTHPIQTQGVTYIIQRATSMASLFYLASLSLYVKSRLLQCEKSTSGLRRFYYCGSLITAIMAMFTKEIAITLPLVIWLYEFSFLRTKTSFNWRRPIPFLYIMLIVPLTMLFTKTVNFGEMRRLAEPSPNISPLHYLLTQFRVIVTYIRLLFVPLNQNLDYDYPIARTLLDLPMLASLLFLVSIFIFAIRIFRNHRLISFSIFWFFLTLLPESSIIPIKDVISEHRLYLPMVAYSIFLVSTMYYFLVKHALKSMLIVMIMIITCYSLLTYARNAVWRDEVTLWSDVIRKSPRKAEAYNNRGAALYLDAGNFDQALSDFNKAIEIYPRYVDAYSNRGNVYADKLNFDQALSDYNKAIGIDHNFGHVYYNRAVAYFEKQEYNKSWEDIHKAEELGFKANTEFLKKLKEASGR